MHGALYRVLPVATTAGFAIGERSVPVVAVEVAL
jgi:hypothetical protein